MEKNRTFTFWMLADLAVCCLWMLLVAHDNINIAWMHSLLLLFPALRIWTNFLMQRRSRLMLAPIAMLMLLTPVLFMESGPAYLLFIAPCTKLLMVTSAMFDIDLFTDLTSPNALNSLYEYDITAALIGCLWMLAIPIGVYVCRLCKKQLQPSSLNVWKAFALCAYIFAIALSAAFLFSRYFKITLAAVLLAMMLLLIPAIFYRGNIKGLFNRKEIFCLLTFVIFALGYMCGITMNLISAMMLCLLPLAFFALVNWYVRRAITYKEIMLIVGASVLFWTAQYTVNMLRLLILFVSLAMMALPFIRFALDTNKHWKSAGVYVLTALVLPVICLGYNPYSVLEARREWRFDEYRYAQNGLLCVSVRDGLYVGLRDRYGIILPPEYEYIEILESSKPYCKVRKNRMWQIYDIERHELVSDEWFEDVIPCGKHLYRLESGDGEKYLEIPFYYDRYERRQPAVIFEELP